MVQIFRVFIPVSVIGLVLSEFLLVFACYLCGSVLLTRFVNPDFSLIIFVQNEAGLFKIATVVICIVAGLYFQNLYSNFRVRSLTILIQQLCLVIGCAFLLQALFSYLRRPEWALARWGMI